MTDVTSIGDYVRDMCAYLDPKALRTAVDFLSVRSHIVIQVPKADDVPYVKRYLSKIVGEPRKMIGNTWYYEDKCITVVALSNDRDMVGYNRTDLFYVGYEDCYDERVLCFRGFYIEYRPLQVIQLWKSIGMNESKMYSALLNEGYDHESAIKFLIDGGALHE